MLRELFRGFIRLHILHHAAEQPVYGVWLIAELGKHGYTLSPGTLYPILHRLEADGYLQSTYQVIEGRRRRYYQITPQGIDVLAEAKMRLRELVSEVLPGFTTQGHPHPAPSTSRRPEKPSGT